MALRLLHNQCIIHQHHRFISLLSSSSSRTPLQRLHEQHRYSSNNHDESTNLRYIKLFPQHLSHNNDEPHPQNNKYYTNWRRKHQFLLHYHHTKHHFSSTNKSELNKQEEHVQTVSNPTKHSTQMKNIVSRVGNVTFNIFYYTIDSFISPSRGYARICNVCGHIKHGALHFWGATKLMWTDIRSASKILRKLRREGELTYRERRQLRRVALDAFKFIPMLIIVLIPFLEAALPFFLYMFPNMLPSRFQTEHMKLEKRKKLLSARIGLAAFFEDTLHEYMKELKSSKETLTLSLIFDKLKCNEEISNEQILKVASLFDDEITLDNASHSVLSNMCRYMDLNTFGTTVMLRHRLYVKIREIRREDQGIRKEGMEHIPSPLLKQLLRERGMRSDFEEWVLRSNLSKWLELSLDNEVPVSLLVMSRIFTLQHIPGQDTTDRLKDTISTIGDATTKEMLVERGGVDDLKTEKEIIERQQQLIDEEAQLQVTGDEKKKEDSKRHMRDLTDSVETLASEGVVDPEKQDINQIREKLKEIQEYSRENEIKINKKQSKISARIDKMIEKSSLYADETGTQFENTLKRIDIDNLTTDEQLKHALTDALTDTLTDQSFSDEQIHNFLKDLKRRKEKQPNIKLSKLIEELSDEYHQDIDIK
eukprot:158545_1